MMRTWIPFVAGVALLVAAAGASASDEAGWKDLKTRYEKAAKRHDRVDLIERKRLIQDMLEFIDQKACRKFVRKVFGDERNVDNRIAVVQVLGASPDPKDLDFLVKQLGSKGERHRGPKIALGEGLGWVEADAHAVLVPRVLHHVKKTRKKDDVRLSLLEGLAMLYEAKEHEKVLALADGAKPRDLFEIYLAAGRHGEEAAVDALVAAADHPDYRAVLGATLGLAETDSPKAYPKLIELLGNGDPLVSEVAAGTLGMAKHAPAQDALVDLIAEAPLRGREAARRALRDITGKDMGHDVEGWRNVVAGKPGKAGKVELPRFFGQEVASDRVVVFLDLSRSMSFKDRLARAQDGLVEFIDSLPEDAEIGAYGVARANRAYSEAPAPVGREREKVKLWLRDQLHERSADFKIALLDALEKHPDADTFLLATDSQPRGTGGEETAWETIEVFRQVNRVRRIRLYIAFVNPGGRFEEQETEPEEWEDTKENLKLWAELSGGTFIDVAE